MKTFLAISMAMLMIVVFSGRATAENDAAGSSTVKCQRSQQRAERKAHIQQQKQENKQLKK